MVNWYYNLLTNRIISMQLGEADITRCIKIGFPQGKVCSAKFWIIAFDEAIRILNSKGVTGQGFADDCNGSIGGTDLNYMYTRMQRVLNNLVSWGKTKGLTFSPEKSVIILFYKGKKPQKKYLLMDGKKLPHVETTNYLGVTLDEKLSWKPHIENTLSKCLTNLRHITAAFKKKVSSKPKLIKWIYTEAIRPKLTYCSMIWAHRVNKSLASKLNTLNRAATMAITPVPRSTPQAALEIIYDIEPLNIHLQRLSCTARTSDKNTT